jgi:hypothetical protein
MDGMVIGGQRPSTARSGAPVLQGNPPRADGEHPKPILIKDRP